MASPEQQLASSRRRRLTLRTRQARAASRRHRAALGAQLLARAKGRACAPRQRRTAMQMLQARAASESRPAVLRAAAGQTQVECLQRVRSCVDIQWRLVCTLTGLRCFACPRDSSEQGMPDRTEAKYKRIHTQRLTEECGHL